MGMYNIEYDNYIISIDEDEGCITTMKNKKTGKIINIKFSNKIKRYIIKILEKE